MNTILNFKIPVAGLSSSKLISIRDKDTSQAELPGLIEISTFNSPIQSPSSYPISVDESIYPQSQYQPKYSYTKFSPLINKNPYLRSGSKLKYFNQFKKLEKRGTFSYFNVGSVLRNSSGKRNFSLPDIDSRSLERGKSVKKYEDNPDLIKKLLASGPFKTEQFRSHPNINPNMSKHKGPKIIHYQEEYALSSNAPKESLKIDKGLIRQVEAEPTQLKKADNIIFEKELNPAYNQLNALNRLHRRRKIENLKMRMQLKESDKDINQFIYLMKAENFDTQNLNSKHIHPLNQSLRKCSNLTLDFGQDNIMDQLTAGQDLNSVKNINLEINNNYYGQINLVNSSNHAKNDELAEFVHAFIPIKRHITIQGIIDKKRAIKAFTYLQASHLSYLYGVENYEFVFQEENLKDLKYIELANCGIKVINPNTLELVGLNEVGVPTIVQISDSEDSVKNLCEAIAWASKTSSANFNQFKSMANAKSSQKKQKSQSLMQ